MVGATIGALAGFVALAAAHVAPHSLVAALALAILIFASGAIHLDGFLDGCDALFASVPAARRLEILKDPRHGTFALAGLVILATFWYASLVELPVAAYPATLALAGALGRASAVLGATMFPYARGGTVDAFGYAFVLAAIASGAYLLWPPAVAFVPAAAGIAWLVARWIAARLGGTLPGDGYGFIATIVDVAVVVAAAALSWAGRWPGHG